MASKRIKTKAIEAPTSQQEAEKLLLEIGTLQREVSRIEHDMNDELSEIKARYEEDAAPLTIEIDEKFNALHTWAEANKKQLLKGKSKTAKLKTGELLWRTSPLAVTVTKVKEVIQRLKDKGLKDLVRNTESVNKEAILQDPERVKGIAGIKVGRREEFVVKPFESEIERSVPLKNKAA